MAKSLSANRLKAVLFAAAFPLTACQHAGVSSDYAAASEQCRIDGYAYYREFFLAKPSGAWGGTGLWHDTPDFHFSRRLNTCLISIKVFRNTIPRLVLDQVDDVRTGKPVLYGYFEYTPGIKNSEVISHPPSLDVPNHAGAEYYARVHALFEE